MLEKSLVMKFENEAGKLFNVTIKDIKDNLIALYVATVMDLIILKDVFLTTGGKLVKKIKAEVITKEVNAVEII